MTQTVSQAVARRESGAVAVMWGRRKHFAAVLPKHVDVETFLGTAAAALFAKPDLAAAAAANPDSLIAALMRCAALGHQPGTDDFYLLWRNIKGPDGRKRPTVQGLEGYRGIIERMYRSGAVASVVVREVCANDKFRFVEGVDDRPVHSTGGEGGTGAAFFGPEGSRDRGAMVGVYSYAVLLTGAVSRVVLLNRDDVMAARESSTAKDAAESPWNRLDAGPDHPEFRGRSMWWKTSARRLEPWVPTSAEYRREIARAAAKASGLDRPPASGAPAAAGSGPEHYDVVDAEIIGDGDDANGEEGHAAPAIPAPEGGGPPSAQPAGPLPGGEDVSAAVPPDGRGDGPAAPPAAPGEPDGGDPAGGGTEKHHSDPAASPVDQVQLRRINALFRQMEWTDRDDRLRAASALAGREITALADLTAAEASPLIETLARISRQPDPAVALTTAVAQVRSSRAPGKEPAGG